MPPHVQFIVTASSEGDLANSLDDLELLYGDRLSRGGSKRLENGLWMALCIVFLEAQPREAEGRKPPFWVRVSTA
jgi:hypothetical protein